MPRRNYPLVNNEIYHIFNRGNLSLPIFKTKSDFKKFINVFLYYQNKNVSIRYSKFINLSASAKVNYLKKTVNKSNFLVDIICFCLMPNHFHFLLKQRNESGIKEYLRLITNSYSKHFNLKYNRKGYLFEGRFKAVRIETNEQLIHVSRYIHLNPYSSYLVKDLNDLMNYEFSSLNEYVSDPNTSICQKEIIISQFSKNKSYLEFLSKQADYQRSLESIKHLIFE